MSATSRGTSAGSGAPMPLSSCRYSAVMVGDRAFAGFGVGVEVGWLPAAVGEAWAGFSAGAALCAWCEPAALAGTVDAVAGLGAGDPEFLRQLREWVAEPAAVEGDVAHRHLRE